MVDVKWRYIPHIPHIPQISQMSYSTPVGEENGSTGTGIIVGSTLGSFAALVAIVVIAIVIYKKM